VPNHDHYREICAAASIGQATPEELFELEQHAAECHSCREAYFAYLNLASEQFAVANQTPVLSSHDAKESLNTELFTRRFLERAEKEGIVFSQDVGAEVRTLAPKPEAPAKRAWWPSVPLGLAASLLIAGMVSTAYFYGKAGSRAQGTGDREERMAASSEARVEALDGQIARLTSVNTKLAAEIAELKEKLRSANAQLNAADEKVESASENRQQLERQRDSLDANVQNLQQQLSDSQAVLSQAQQESAKLREHAAGLENTVVADRVQMQDLTEELKEKANALDKERQLLALGHDVTDLMGARNLHIVDVVDTDPRGKTQPAFGRIFFTEGKSLLFYAYDLNGNKIQKADYQYRVWAKKEGQDKQVRSLGIFYSDDKSQRRWVFKCTDPNVLNEIDSVFVTLEPPQSDPAHPHGSNLMYAYLRGQPNHP
jgi:hypothetical protein